jgi:rhamnose utilization protein RhaD (predicted bifunctional aldolase and dehydrogenase)
VFCLYTVSNERKCTRDRREKENLDQVGRVGVLLGSDKVLLDGSGGNESVEDVDGTRLQVSLILIKKGGI